MPARFFATALFCLVLACPVWAAGDWPQFRGPTGQGQAGEARLPLEWSATRNIAWKQPVPGRAWSSPILQGGRLYLTTAVAAEASGGGPLRLRVLCLDEADGRVRWDTAVFAPAGAVPKGHAKNSQASPTPLLEDSRLYVHFGHLGTACLDLDGKVLWRNQDLQYPPVHGNGGSPVIVGNALIFNCDGASQPFVVALDKRTGKELWRTPRRTKVQKSFSFATPLVITVQGRPQVISPGSGAVCAYDPATGRELWRVRYGEGYSVVPRPVQAHGLLFIGTGYDRASVLAIRPDGQGDVTDTHVAWTTNRGAPNTPSMLVVGDELYFVSDAGIASCVDARTGQVHWSERVGGGYSSSPIAAAGRIYFQNEEGRTVVVKAGKAFEVLATNELGEKTLASWAVGVDALYIRTEGHLFKVQSGRGG
jgi:outer membrane protein assembly factor BamB